MVFIFQKATIRVNLKQLAKAEIFSAIAGMGELKNIRR